MSDPLIWARVVHFASTVLLSGTVLFVSFVAEPAFRRALADDPINIIVRFRLARLVWITSGLVLISGAAWFLLQTARMVDLPVSQIFSNASLLTVLTETDFGRDWIARLLLLILLAGTTLRSDPKQVGSPGRRLVIVALAASFVGSLAWAGHGAAGSGLTGGVHLASDALHLMAAAAWVGALVPLAMFFGAMEAGNERSVMTAREVTLRFSTLGTISVCTLLATGIINSWMLVGSVSALTATDYGRLLSLKILLFIAMLATAAVNRLVLTPHLMRAQPGTARVPLHHLRNTSALETVLGAAILIIVGALGTLPPGIEELQ